MIRILKAAAVAAGFWAASFGAANAALVTWTLQDWVFDDGGTASGSFVFDADTDAYSDIMITTTDGTTLTGASYGVPNPASPGASIIILTIPSVLADLTGTPVIAVIWASALTNAGGTVLADLTAGFRGEFSCANATCSGPAGPSRLLVSGLVTTSPVPLPAALPLFLAGIAGIGAAGRRRKKAEA